jgi:hypothetical protein
MARSRIVNVANLEQFTAINVLSDPGHIGGPVIVPNCAQISLVWSLEDGKTAHNVLYGRYSGTFAGSAAQATAILTALASGGAWSALAAFLATSTVLGSVSLRDMNSANNALIFASSGSAPGTSASPALPNEVAAVISLRTARTGPANRGRIYVPGFATNALGTGNVVAATVVTALNAWANTIPTALSGQGYTFVLGQPARAAYTGSTGTQHPARAATSQPVTSQALKDNHWDSQRRRGLK